MNTTIRMTLLAVVALAVLAVGCDQEDVDLGTDAGIVEQPLLTEGFEGVDLLLMVDDSSSMGEEQQILSTGLFQLINTLVYPTADWSFPATDDLRIGVVSSDMGLQFGDNGDLPSESYGTQFQCPGRGNNGELQTYNSGATIMIAEGVIPCDDSATQCPPGWACEDGVCNDPDGIGDAVPCPPLGDWDWAETTPDVNNGAIALQGACLADLGTSGCGFEQQLKAAGKGAATEGFVRDGALLAVMLVSDEEDCSIESGDMFGVPELNDITQPHMLNVACSENSEYLYPVSHFMDQLLAAKQDRPASVVFSAITGVPIDPTCQGAGSGLDGCLDHPDMAAEPYLETGSSGTQSWVNAPACTRMVGDTEVTKARPGRRYVGLAQLFGEMSYVYSICNEDWSPAMTGVGQLIGESAAGQCHPEPLQWDPAEKVSECDIVIRYLDLPEDVCPFELDEGVEPETVEIQLSDGQFHHALFCPLPKLPAPLGCQSAREIYPEDSGELGWYYCECDPATQEGCECENTIELTAAAHNAATGRYLSVRCPAQ